MTDYISKIIESAQDLTADVSTANVNVYRGLKAAMLSGEIDAFEFNARLEQHLFSFDHLRRLKFWIEVARHEGALP